MNIYIASFLVIGACFGLASFSNRHLFSEGPSKAEDIETSSEASARIYWLLVCTLLWPIMVLTGINTAMILAKRRSK